MARDDDAGALPMLEQAVRAQPGDGEARYNLGAVQANLGRTADACATWRAILQGQGTAQVKDPARRGMAALGCPP
jgi:cytochrome c-type biogenesis protein CcmH/NrfG